MIVKNLIAVISLRVCKDSRYGTQDTRGKTKDKEGQDFFRHGLTRISTFGDIGFTDYADYAAVFGRYKKMGWGGLRRRKEIS